MSDAAVMEWAENIVTNGMYEDYELLDLARAYLTPDAPPSESSEPVGHDSETFTMRRRHPPEPVGEDDEDVVSDVLAVLSGLWERFGDGRTVVLRGVAEQIVGMVTRRSSAPPEGAREPDGFVSEETLREIQREGASGALIVAARIQGEKLPGALGAWTETATVPLYVYSPPPVDEAEIRRRAFEEVRERWDAVVTGWVADPGGPMPLADATRAVNKILDRLLTTGGS